MSDIANQFTGLPLQSLIAQPMIDLAKSQEALVAQYLDSLNKLAFEQGDGDSLKTKILDVEFDRVVEQGDGTTTTQPTQVKVPLAAVAQIPCFTLDTAEIDFSMEVKTQETSKNTSTSEGKFSASYSSFWGVKASISGSVSTSKENTRSTDKSAKYNIKVTAKQQPQAEGMSKLMDILQANITPITAGGK
jgi:hypothetical protein